MQSMMTAAGSTNVIFAAYAPVHAEIAAQVAMVSGPPRLRGVGASARKGI